MIDWVWIQRNLGNIAQLLGQHVVLAVVPVLAAIVISIPLGIWAAVHKGKWADQLIRIVSLVGLSFPNFWLATMMVLLFSITLKWLPPSGMTGPASVSRASGSWRRTRSNASISSGMFLYRVQAPKNNAAGGAADGGRTALPLTTAA